MLFFDGIRTVLLEPVRRLFLGKSMLDTRMELGERFLDRPGISWYLRTLGRIYLGGIYLGGICFGGVSLGRISLEVSAAGASAKAAASAFCQSSSALPGPPWRA